MYGLVLRHPPRNHLCPLILICVPDLVLSAVQDFLCVTARVRETKTDIPKPGEPYGRRLAMTPGNRKFATGATGARKSEPCGRQPCGDL